MEGLKFVKPEDVKEGMFDPVDPLARKQAEVILQRVRENGLKGVLEVAVELKDIENIESKIFYSKDDLQQAYNELDEKTKLVLISVAERIKLFAKAQRSSVQEISVPIPGGMAGHQIAPVSVAGCYAPGGRYPLPSSVLMTAITARVAGVETVWVASPRPALATLAAAHVANADGLLAVGGAQAIGAMAYGISPISACDVIVGPGNKWVTAAKSLVSNVCAIDMLAGPSEVLIIADNSCNPDVVAADLLAQAEHDVEARPILVCTDVSIAEAVNSRITQRLQTLSTANIAQEAIKRGFACICNNIDAAVNVSDIIGPEHLEIHTLEPQVISQRCKKYGAVFIGSISAEVLGDYGAGPNHVLPTCGTARYTGGLSVFTFLRIRTFINIVNLEESQQLVRDSIALARIEGLEGHAQAAECRLIESNIL